MSSRRPPRSSTEVADTGDLEAENRALRARLGEITNEATRNATLLDKIQRREIELMRAGTLADLLERLVIGLKGAYQLDRVLLVLSDPQHDIRHLAGDSVPPEVLAHVRHVDQCDALFLSFGGLTRPWLGNRLPSEAIRVLRPSAAGGSFALIPLPRADERLGVLVFESRDPDRFRPELASDFLAHLGVVSAVCVENAVNRARLLRTGVTDFLTGFHNRRYLHARLREELARAHRTAGTVGLLMIDIDFFKPINDTHGHLAGDAVLKEIARRIAGEIRSSDTAARFGGDEFAVLMGGAAHADLTRVAARMRQALAKSPIAVSADVSHTVTLSIGGAVAEPAPDERDYRALAERLIASADASLYRVKEAGRDGFAVAESFLR